MRSLIRRAVPGACAILAAMLIQSCAVWNFVDVRYQNVTGYFNTYYNAATLFDEAVAEIRENQRNLSAAQRDLPPARIEPEEHVGPGNAADVAGDMKPAASGATPMGQPQRLRGAEAMKKDFGTPSGAITKLDKVIEKCSRILVSYPKSKWVDNALLMIGRAYYYKREHNRAETKFRELLEGFPEGDLYGQGLLWLGRNYMEIDRYDKAERALDDAVEWGIRNSESALVAEAYYSRGELFIALNDRDRALESFRKGVDVAGDKDQRIQLQLALAREEERRGDRKAAARAYRDIISLDPSRDLAFSAELNYARLSRETGEVDNAVNTLLDMLDNPLYIEYDPEIQLEIGHLYTSVKEYKSALDQYTYVDTTFRNQAVAAEAFFASGRILEYQSKDYDRAFEAYNAAKLAYPGAPGAKLGGKRADDFGEYRKLRGRMFEADTLLFFVLHPDSLTVRDSVQAVADSLTRMQRAKDRSGTQTEEERLAEKMSRRRPHGRNTGRVNPFAVQTTPGPGVGTGAGTPSATAQVKSGNLPLYRKLDLRKLSPDSVLAALSELRMEMGFLMFDRIRNVDSAYYYYNLALEGSLPDSLRANAWYTMASISRTMGDTVMARDYEDRLIQRLPRSRFALNVMRERGLPLPLDTLTAARAAYDRAAVALERGRAADGIQALQTMASSYPFSEMAVRAKLAIAMSYEEQNEGQKALEVYRQMVKDHPNSPYSQRGKDILAAIDRAEKAPQVEKLRKEAEEKQLEAIRKLEEESRQRANAHKNDDELKAERDEARKRPPKADPTKDSDFPLNLPGDYKPKAPEQKPPAPQRGRQGVEDSTALPPPTIPLTPRQGTVPPPDTLKKGK